MRPRTRALVGALALAAVGAVVLLVVLPPRRPSAATPPVVVTPQPPATPSPAEPAASPTVTPAPPSQPVEPPPGGELSPPFLRIDSPVEGSIYHSRLVLRGRVVDPGNPGSASGIESAGWSIAGTDRAGSIPLSTDGSFRVVVPTDGLNSDLSLVVRVQRRGGAAAESTIGLVDAGTGPGIIVASPAPSSAYGSSVKVTGRVNGPRGVADPLGEIATLSWSVDGTDLGGPVPFGRDGSFGFDFSTVGLHGDIALNVRAADKNGHPSLVTITLADRATGPALTVESPADNSAYGESVTVTGRVGEASEVRSLSWRVVGQQSLSGDIPPRADGSFSFSFPAAGLTGTQVLELKAEDLNGRTRVATLTLAQPQAAPPASAPASAPATTGQAPELILSSPADRSPYGATIAVSGKARTAASGGIAAVSWSIAGSALTGTAPVGADGGFAFTIQAAGLHGTQALSVKAAGRNGGTTEKVVVLLDDARGLPITITSPAEGGYYKDITVIEGRVGDQASAAGLKSFTYEVAAHAELSGKVVAAADGTFKLPLYFSGVSGDVAVHFVAEDLNGHVARAAVSLHDGRLKPQIVLRAPGKGSSYGSVIRVAGTVTDPYAGKQGLEGIDSVSWLIAPVDFSKTSTPVRGTITLGAGGTFRFSLPTKSLAGAQDLTLTATGRTGNRAELTVRLAQGDGDLPGFAAVPGDRALTASWDPIPFAVRYDVVWAPAAADAQAAGRTIQGVSPPYTLTGLQNGSLYTLQVRVAFDDGARGSSPQVRFIPLSPRTLAPRLTGDYQQIRLAWEGITGANKFDVWRSSAGETGPAKIASELAARVFVDSTVEFGREYSYQISPAGPLAPMSAAVKGKSLDFPVDKLVFLGRAPFKEGRRVTVNGGYAFVASGAQGVRIVDVSSPTGPATVGTLDTTDAWDVAVRGSYAYVADGDSGLRVADISAPREPLILGSRKTTDARAVVLSGNYAYVADGDKGLKVIDISDNRLLPRVATMETQNALGLALSGTRLYVADGPGGLKIVDISRPTVPALRASLPTTDARGVSVQGGIAVVADGAAGLRVVDVKDPDKPVLISTYAAGPAMAAALDGAFAYVADGKAGVKIVNLEDPARPTLFTSHASAGAAGISVEERRAYIAASAGMELLRVQILGRSYKLGACDTGGKAYDVTVAGDWAYVSAHAQGIRVVNVAAPQGLTNASLAGSVGTRSAQAVSVQDKLAFVADGTDGVRIFDISPLWAGGTGATALEIGSYRPGGNVRRAVPHGSYVYAVAGEGGVHVLDMSTPSAPKETATVRTTDASDIVLRDKWAFVADGEAGVRIFDVTDPAKITAVPAVIKMDARNLVLNGNLLIVAGGTGVTVVDVTDPAAPRVRGRYETATAQAVAASGIYAYVAEGYKGLTVLDLSRPSRPAVVSSCEDVFAVGVALKNGYAIVVDSFGLRAIRILIPAWLAH